MKPSVRNVTGIKGAKWLKQGGAEHLKLCLEGNKTLERGATMEEVSEAIKTMRSGKAPGPDSISNKCLKMLKMNRKL
ncbi:hypothetical protein QYF61_023185 [Mycteria americana]|uniref:Uncharacterized protein n=1 Tax=Mycteria americana TaxID=33587 RepID=A0AAN7N531_MYCAM|nr:hypothetical protein QYF61_023185 [Mycteria americana]